MINMNKEKARNLQPVIEYELKHHEGLQHLVDSFGYIIPVIVNRRTMKVLNSIVLQAYLFDKSTAEIPVFFIELDQQLEVIASVAVNGGLDGFLCPIPTDAQRVIQAILNSSQQQLSVLAPKDYIAEILDMYAGLQPIKPKTTKYSDPYDIPILDINHQITELPQSWVRWGATRQDTPQEAIHFYIDDNKFSSLESDPDKVFKSKPSALIELNYSTNDQQPTALVIADIWRKRTVARRWQSHGIKIAVDMNVSSKFTALNLMGVPKGWKAYANRAYSDDLKHLMDAYHVAQEHARTRDILYFVYGRNTAKDLCQSNGWIWIDSNHYG